MTATSAARLLPATLLALLLCASAASPCAAEDGKILLRYKFAPGEAYVVTTDVLTETTTSGNRNELGVKSRDRLMAVEADGAKITLERSCISVEAKLEDVTPNDLHILSRGQKLRLATSPDGQRRTLLSSPIKGYEDHLIMGLPERPVAVGESWPENGEVDVPFIGKMEIRGDWTFSKLAQINGKRLAYLLYKGSMRDTRRGASARDEVRLVFDVDAGVPQKLKAVHDISFTVQDTRKIDTKVTIECAIEREAPAAAPKPEEW